MGATTGPAGFFDLNECPLFRKSSHRLVRSATFSRRQPPERNCDNQPKTFRLIVLELEFRPLLSLGWFHEPSNFRGLTVADHASAKQINHPNDGFGYHREDVCPESDPLLRPAPNC